MADETKGIYLSSFFSEADIVFDKTVPSQFNLLHDLVSCVVKNHLPDVRAELILDEVLHRERRGPTVIGNGIALPHARIAGLEKPYIALGIYPAGVLSTESTEPVKLVFLLLIPESQPARYLQILRALSTLLRDADTVDRLAYSESPEHVMQFLRRSEMKLPDYICAGDLMSSVFDSIRAEDPLSTALDSFMLNDKLEIPIVDEQSRLKGAVDIHALLECFVPKGLRRFFPMLQDNPAPTMEVLAECMHKAHSIPAKHAMKEDLCTCYVDTPAREIAADMAEKNATKCYVVDKESHLIGVITLAQFFRRILKD
jgi:mannitol/fructose-specific phosphotransferase system IIA component (Ntr-type)